MSIELLDKTRRINRLLHDNREGKVIFNDICRILGDMLQSQVFVISSKGKMLGTFIGEGKYVLAEFPQDVGKYIDSMLNERFHNVLSTKENVNLELLGFDSEAVRNVQALVAPIEIGGERLGTLFLYRKGNTYGIEDIILSEYGATVIGLEMMRAVREETDNEIRKKAVFSSAVMTLSPLERRAMIVIFHELDGAEGTLITSKVAEKVGITRTVIVNALRKLESAGLIKTKSSGMKGTHIVVLNDIVFTEFHNLYEEKRTSGTQTEL